MVDGHRAALLGIAGACALAVAFASGMALGSRGGAHSPAAQTQTVSADRAIALVVGQARSTDHMTFDAWYRARMGHLAPGIDIEYVALLSGNSACGSWLVDALAVPGPFHGTEEGLHALNQYGPIAAVDATSGQIDGVDKRSASTTYYKLSNGCALHPTDAGQTWLDEFLSGAPAWPFTPQSS